MLLLISVIIYRKGKSKFWWLGPLGNQSWMMVVVWHFHPCYSHLLLYFVLVSGNLCFIKVYTNPFPCNAIIGHDVGFYSIPEAWTKRRFICAQGRSREKIQAIDRSLRRKLPLTWCRETPVVRSKKNAWVVKKVHFYMHVNIWDNYQVVFNICTLQRFWNEEWRAFLFAKFPSYCIWTPNTLYSTNWGVKTSMWNVHIYCGLMRDSLGVQDFGSILLISIGVVFSSR